MEKPALIYAVDLLAMRPHSTKQLITKLKRKGYEAEEIDIAIRRLEERHYLDDQDLCCRQYEYYLRNGKLSLTALNFKLVEKGFSQQDIAFAKDNCSIDISNYEANVALRLLNQHFNKKDLPLTKYQGYLYRKGFSSSAIRTALDNFLQVGSDKFY